MWGGVSTRCAALCSVDFTGGDTGHGGRTSFVAVISIDVDCRPSPAVDMQPLARSALLPCALAGAANSELWAAERIEPRQIDILIVQRIQSHRAEERFRRLHQKDRLGEPAVIETTAEVNT
jgi:hypothetical protein